MKTVIFEDKIINLEMVSYIYLQKAVEAKTVGGIDLTATKNRIEFVFQNTRTFVEFNSYHEAKKQLENILDKCK